MNYSLFAVNPLIGYFKYFEPLVSYAWSHLQP